MGVHQLAVEFGLAKMKPPPISALLHTAQQNHDLRTA